MRVELLIDQPTPGILRCTVLNDGIGIDSAEVPYGNSLADRREGVDNVLLTTVDNLFKRNTLDKFALKSVQIGQGIDKNSSLYRIVTSFAAAVAVASQGLETR